MFGQECKREHGEKEKGEAPGVAVRWKVIAAEERAMAAALLLGGRSRTEGEGEAEWVSAASSLSSCLSTVGRKAGNTPRPRVD
jgi:hypothetical protein